MRSSLFFSVVLALSMTSAEALTIAPLRFSDLVTEADAVVYGRISAIDGQWTSDRQGIESLVTLDVIDRFKGRGGSSVIFKVPGGRAGNLINVLPGAPTFREGDLVVLFLASRGPTIPTPVGLSQGVLRVNVDPRSGELIVGKPLGFDGESGPLVRGSAARAPIQLGTLASSVRARAEVAR
jgi:hypothetical protein